MKHWAEGRCTPEHFANPVRVVHGSHASCRVPRQQHMCGASQVVLLKQVLNHSRCNALPAELILPQARVLACSNDTYVQDFEDSTEVVETAFSDSDHAVLCTPTPTWHATDHLGHHSVSMVVESLWNIQPGLHSARS